MKKRLLSLLALAALGTCADTFDVARFGARPDGATDNTAAIQKAIDACSAKGGGRVLVPGGGVYKTYTLNLKNNVDLHIDRGAKELEKEFRYDKRLFRRLIGLKDSI